MLQTFQQNQGELGLHRDTCTALVLILLVGLWFVFALEGHSSAPLFFSLCWEAVDLVLVVRNSFQDMEQSHKWIACVHWICVLGDGML